MDQFNVPRKVNRHVYKAVFNMVVPGEYVSYEDILHEVRYTMRNLNPTKDLPGCIKKSIYNMQLMGLFIEKDGEYTLRDTTRHDRGEVGVEVEGTESGSAEDASDDPSSDDNVAPTFSRQQCVADLFRAFCDRKPKGKQEKASKKTSESKVESKADDMDDEDMDKKEE
ncbi:hypothetical protein KR074_009676 [Drosophila pseudoananassae]|nr:hypothetical protein KR074_009676 [Drosophila pseudoananassae]